MRNSFPQNGSSRGKSLCGTFALHLGYGDVTIWNGVMYSNSKYLVNELVHWSTLVHGVHLHIRHENSSSCNRFAIIRLLEKKNNKNFRMEVISALTRKRN